jgi:hypothetical protein
MQINDRVRRDEARATTGATVLALEGAGAEAVALIAYDEGGEGWWPVAALRPIARRRSRKADGTADAAAGGPGAG